MPYRVTLTLHTADTESLAITAAGFSSCSINKELEKIITATEDN